MVNVAVVESHRGDHRTRECERQRLHALEAVGRTMARRGRRALRAANGFGDGGLHCRSPVGLEQWRRISRRAIFSGTVRVSVRAGQFGMATRKKSGRRGGS